MAAIPTSDFLKNVFRKTRSLTRRTLWYTYPRIKFQTACPRWTKVHARDHPDPLVHWGASDPRVGNNPLIIAVPRPQGHVVLDMAMSQFSFGVLASYRMRGEQLPVVGGFDAWGQLTRDAGAIEASKRALPIGYWKGSGLALMLDMLAGLLSGGYFTRQVPADPEQETRLSQMFIALDVSRIDQAKRSAGLVDQIISHVQASPVAGEQARYPGERVLQTRKENLLNGIPVVSAIWHEVEEMSAK